MFTHEKSLAKGPYDKAETQTLKSYTFSSPQSCKTHTRLIFGWIYGATCDGGTVQSVTS